MTPAAVIAQNGRSPPHAHETSAARSAASSTRQKYGGDRRSEEHTSELQSRENVVCRLLPEKKKNMSGNTGGHAAPRGRDDCAPSPRSGLSARSTDHRPTRLTTCPVARRGLHSFPTRRSSDLER